MRSSRDIRNMRKRIHHDSVCDNMMNHIDNANATINSMMFVVKHLEMMRDGTLFDYLMNNVNDEFISEFVDSDLFDIANEYIGIEYGGTMYDFIGQDDESEFDADIFIEVFSYYASNYVIKREANKR